MFYRTKHVVMLGSDSDRYPSAGHVMVNVTQAIAHEGHGSSNDGYFYDDIAILKLAINVTLSCRSSESF
jgi:hypothetical protein